LCRISCYNTNSKINGNQAFKEIMKLNNELLLQVLELGFGYAQQP